MIKKVVSAISFILLVGLAACGQAAAPTLSAAEIQQTGVALAWTGLAMTQTAMPSATPIPPTNTDLPTLPVLPTLAPFIITPGTPGLQSTPTGDLCSQPMPPKTKGNSVQVKFLNKTGGTVLIAFAMNKPNGLGECGTYTYSLGLYNSPIVQSINGMLLGVCMGNGG